MADRYTFTGKDGVERTFVGDRPPTPAEMASLETAESGPQGSATGRFLEGAAKNLNPIAAVQGVWNALPIPEALGGSGVLSPVRTAGSILQSNLAELSKAADNFKQGRYSEAAGHGAAGLLPVIGPAAAAAGERMASGDVAGGLGEGAGLLVPFGAGPALKGAKVAARGGVAAARALPAGSEALDAIAALADRASTDRMVDVGGPKVGPNKLRLNNKLADVAPQLARDADLSALSRQGLHSKVAAKLEEATANLDDVADSRLVSTQVPTGPVLASLDDKIAKLTAQPVDASRPIPSATQGGAQARPVGASVQPSPNQPQIQTLQKIRDEVAALGPVAPYESVRRIRNAWDQVAKVKYNQAMSPDYLAKQGEANAAMSGTGAIRDALSAADPATAAANAQYSLYKTANDVLQATEETERARPRVLRGIVARTGGAMVGAEAGGMGGAIVGTLLGSVVERVSELAPTLKIVVARQLASVADLLRGGQSQQAADALRKIGSRLPAKVAGPMGQQANTSPSQMPQEPRAARQ